MAEYHVENFGCRASRADGESIAAALRHAGLCEAEDHSAANLVILNTCSVTAEADRSARAYLRKVRRANPQSRIVITGCYAQRAPAEVAALDGVHAVIGNSHKSRVVDVALGLKGSGIPNSEAFVPVQNLLNAPSATPKTMAFVWHDPNFAHSELAVLSFAVDAHQTRPNLKIQDGCGNRCSFCIIPLTRGPSRSVSLAECLRAVEAFVDSGGQELVLSGINLGRWGRDLAPAQRFDDLVAAILEQTSVARLRISSVEPMDWTPNLIALFRQYGMVSRQGGVSNHPRLARHAHLPLQSGSDAILRAMHRRYRPWHYAAKVEQIHAALPQTSIGADVMIGFPGETDALFRETYEFIESLPFTYLHVFPFSARPGTPASTWHHASPVPGEAVRERKAAFRSLITAKSETFRKSLVGADLSVVTLAGGDVTCTGALSDNFVKVSVRGRHDSNLLLHARIDDLTEDGLAGLPISAS